MNNRYITFLFSFAATFAVALITFFIYTHAAEGSGAQRIALLFGGKFLPWGWIQSVTFLLFFFGIMETLAIYRKTMSEARALKLGLLPEKENWVLSPQEVMELKLKTIEREKDEKSLLTDVIKKACSKYRSGKSTSEALEVVSATVRINLAKNESMQSIIRYAAWAIPSVGFIGTVIGISNSLGITDRAATPEGITEITSMLNVAFDTTLVSLMLSLILMFFYHRMTEMVETFHSDLEQYVINNLINRIYQPGG